MLQQFLELLAYSNPTKCLEMSKGVSTANNKLNVPVLLVMITLNGETIFRVLDLSLSRWSAIGCLLSTSNYKLKVTVLLMMITTIAMIPIFWSNVIFHLHSGFQNGRPGIMLVRHHVDKGGQSYLDSVKNIRDISDSYPERVPMNGRDRTIRE